MCLRNLIDIRSSGREVLNNVTVQKDISITLEAVPFGTLCPSPDLSNPEGIILFFYFLPVDFWYRQECYARGSVQLLQLSMILFSIVWYGTCAQACTRGGMTYRFNQAASNLMYDTEQCPDCCLPNFASEVMPCSRSNFFWLQWTPDCNNRDCNLGDVKCFVCSSDSPDSTRGKQCTGYLDSSCSVSLSLI